MAAAIGNQGKDKITEVTYNLSRFQTLNYTREYLKHLRDSASVFIWGPPGVGKSTMIFELGDELVMPVMDVRAAQLEAVDLRGIPATFKDYEGKIRADYIPFDSVLPIAEKHGEKGILFLDELNLSEQDVRKAAYQLIWDRKVGNYTVPPGWRVVAAGNNPEDAPGMIGTMVAPLKGRFHHLTISPPNASEEGKQDMFNWYYAHGVHPSVIAFLKWQPEQIYNIGVTKTSNAWPSPRTWVMAAQTLADLGHLDSETGNIYLDTRRDIDRLIYDVSTCVGLEAAHQYVTYTRIYTNLPDPRDILLNGIQGKKIPSQTQVDALYGLSAAVVGNLRTLYQEPDVLDHFFEFLNGIPPEYRFSVMEDCRGMASLYEAMKPHDAYRKSMQELGPYVPLCP